MGKSRSRETGEAAASINQERGDDSLDWAGGSRGSDRIYFEVEATLVSGYEVWEKEWSKG